MCRILHSTPIDRTRDVSYSLFHPYRQDLWCVVFFIPPLSTGPWCVVFLIPSLSTGLVMCRFLDSIPIDKTRDVSYSLSRPYRQDPWCIVFFIPPLSTGPVMCRILYSTPIDRTRDVSYSLFHPYRQGPVMCRWLGSHLIHVPSTGPLPRQHVDIRTKARKGRLRCYTIWTSLLMSYESLWQELNGSVELQ